MMWTALIQTVLGVLKPIFAPLLAYLKGRSDAKRDAELKAGKKDDKIIKDGLDAGRDAADSGKLSDHYFRD